MYIVLTKYLLSLATFLQHKSPDSEGSSTSTDQTGESSQQQSGYGCNVCPETFISSEGLVEHMKVAHDLLRNPLPYATLPCKYELKMN